MLTVATLLAEARAELARLEPVVAFDEARSGAAIVDIRSDSQIAADGVIPGARRIPRNVLEWRLDPASPHALGDLAQPRARIVVVCDEGCQSSLAAATLRRFGLDATDLIGGFRAWRAAGLPVADAATVRGDG